MTFFFKNIRKNTVNKVNLCTYKLDIRRVEYKPVLTEKEIKIQKI